MGNHFLFFLLLLRGPWAGQSGHLLLLRGDLGRYANCPNLDQQWQPQKDIPQLPGNRSVTWEKGEQSPGPQTCYVRGRRTSTWARLG